MEKEFNIFWTGYFRGLLDQLEMNNPFSPQAYFEFTQRVVVFRELLQNPGAYTRVRKLLHDIVNCINGALNKQTKEAYLRRVNGLYVTPERVYALYKLIFRTCLVSGCNEIINLFTVEGLRHHLFN